MPNQRAKNKVFVGFFIDAQLKHRMLICAKSRSLPLSEFVTRAVVEYSEKMIRQSDRPAPESQPAQNNALNDSPANERTNLVHTVEDVWLL